MSVVVVTVLVVAVLVVVVAVAVLVAIVVAAASFVVVPAAVDFAVVVVAGSVGASVVVVGPLVVSRTSGHSLHSNGHCITVNRPRTSLSKQLDSFKTGPHAATSVWPPGHALNCPVVREPSRLSVVRGAAVVAHEG